MSKLHLKKCFLAKPVLLLINSSVCGSFQRSGAMCVRVGVNKGFSVKVVNNGDMVYSSSELHPLLSIV